MIRTTLIMVSQEVRSPPQSGCDLRDADCGVVEPKIRHDDSDKPPMILRIRSFYHVVIPSLESPIYASYHDRI